MALGQNIRQLRERLGLTLAQLSERSQVDVGTLSALENRDSERSRFVAQIAIALGVKPEVLLTTGSIGNINDPITPIGVAHKVAESDTLWSPAQSIQLIDWGTLMQLQNLPQKFECVAPDESMAPRVKKGQIVTFDSSLTAQPGDGVLIADRTGNCYLRLYRERRPGCWEAHALNDAYQPLSSETDGLRVLAVLVGVQARWS